MSSCFEQFSQICIVPQVGARDIEQFVGHWIDRQHLCVRHQHIVVVPVVPLADLMTRAEQWAADIFRCAPLSVRASKEAAMKGLDMTLDEALHASFPMAGQMNASEDFIEGPLAFSQKRPPVWKGR